MADQQGRQFELVADAFQQAEDLFGPGRIERSQGLVEQQEARRGEQGAADGDALGLAAGEGRRVAAREVADACVALACLRRPLPSFHYMVAAFGGADVRCARYATFGTVDLGSSAVEALKDRTACLLANHGMIAIGKTLEAAFQTTVKLETLARQYLMALQGGAPVLLPEEEMARVGKRYGNYGTGLLPG